MTSAPDAPVVGGPVLVIGCGLIGTSLALALREHGVAVHLADAVAAHVEMAASRGAGTAAPVDHPSVVVVAVPPSVAAGVVTRALADHPEAVVTDVASVKVELLDALAGTPGADRFVGGHPMAGKERSGPMAATPRLFEGRPFAVVPLPESRPEAVERVSSLAASVGAVPRSMDARTHDMSVALVSHVPHLASVLVAGLLNDAPEGALDLAGPGLRDVTRIAGSTTGMWLDILGGNAAEITRLLTTLRGSIDTALDALDEDPRRLAELLDAGRSGTLLIPGRHGGASELLATVYVSVSDQPGELSRLMGDTGQSGVNIEDIRIDHELGRLVGQVEIEVDAQMADMLVAALDERGWAAHR
jgi:prephenate dehydrogenase